MLLSVATCCGSLSLLPGPPPRADRAGTVPGVLQSWPSVPALTLASSEVQISHRVRITIASLVGTVRGQIAKKNSALEYR